MLATNVGQEAFGESIMMMFYDELSFDTALIKMMDVSLLSLEDG